MTRLLLVLLVAVVAPTTLIAQLNPVTMEYSAIARRAVPAARESRLFELRTYHAADGKLDALHERFRQHTVRLLARHGIECVGFWVPEKNGGNNLVVLHAYPSAAARTAAWERFAIDPEWRKIKVQTEANGKLVDQIDEVILAPTDFCPAVTAKTTGSKRCFELRLVRGGNAADVAARCKEKTLKLLASHGLDHVGTWTPVGGKMADGITLITLVACESAQSHEKAVRSYRDDPFWSTISTTTDTAWRALQNSERLVLTATDYSALR